MKRPIWGYQPTFFLIPALGMFVLFELYPALGNFWYAFFDYSGIPGLPAEFVGLRNFRWAFTIDRQVIVRSMINGFQYILLIGIPQNLLAFSLAMFLAPRLNPRAKPVSGTLRAIYFVPSILGPVVVSLVWTVLLDTNGLINAMLGSLGLPDRIPWLGSTSTVLLAVAGVQVYTSMGYAFLIYFAQAQSLPGEIVEAARVDGAVGGAMWRYIIIPLMMPAVTVNLVLSAVGSIRLFEVPFLMTRGGPDFHSATLNVVVFRIFSNDQFIRDGHGYAAAVNVVLFLLSALVALLIVGRTSRREVDY